MTVLRRNLEALAAVHPGAVEELELHSGAAAPLELHHTRDGDLTAKFAGRWLHSTRAPRREAERVAADPSFAAADLIVCYGFGLGYHLEAIADRHPETPIVVLEPQLELFRAALGTRPLEPLLRRANLTLIAGPDAAEGLAPALSRIRPRRPAIQRLRAAVDASPEVFAAADEAISRHSTREEINRNTLKRFGRLWVRNLVRNITVMAESPGIARLQNRFSDLPAVVCAAGPTLDEVLPRLAELRAHALIIAVDTSIVPLLRAGVAPDFLVTVDPQYWNTRHLDRADSPQTALVSESATHPRVFRLLSENPRYLCSSLFPLGQYLERGLEPRGALGAGGSVATSAWDFAKVLGCNPVYAAGLDLGFPDHVTHCRGSFFEELAHGFCDRIMPVERYAAQYLWDGGSRRGVATDGTTILTDRRMLLYKWWFESQIAATQQPGPQFRTLSSRGLLIEGMDALPPSDALGEAESQAARAGGRPAIDARLSELHNHHQADHSIERLEHDLSTLAEELSALETRLDPAVEAAQRAVETHRADPEAPLELAILDEADRMIAASRQREIVGFLIHDAAEEIFNSTTGAGESSGESSGERALRNSKTLYSALAESTRYHSQLIDQARRRLGGLSTPAGVAHRSAVSRFAESSPHEAR